MSLLRILRFSNRFSLPHKAYNLGTKQPVLGAIASANNDDGLDDATTLLNCQSSVALNGPIQSHDYYYHQQIRHFHGTEKREILPLVGVAAILLIGRYSWKALNRMDEEWEEYKWELQQYERQKAQKSEDQPLTFGVDLGTLYLKLAQVYKQPKPEIVIGRQGDRYRFNGIMNQDDGIVSGRLAFEKFFYKPNDSTATETVLLPYIQVKDDIEAGSRMIRDVFLPTLDEAMEQLSSTGPIPSRVALALPSSLLDYHSDTLSTSIGDENYKNIICIPEPVATIWGAQSLKLLPPPTTKPAAILVIDVGGLTTNLSIVQKDVVKASITLEEVGGESFVKQLIYRILQETPESYNISNDPVSLQLTHQHARQTVIELSQKNRATVHVPFLFMGQKNPHLEMDISRNVLEQAVESHLREKVIPNLGSDQISTSFPTPTDIKSLITSSLVQLLEITQLTPQSLDSILVVGGGSRHKLFETSCLEGIQSLTGPISEKIVVPDASLRSELTVLGAASLLPNHTYSYGYGLDREA